MCFEHRIQEMFGFPNCEVRRLGPGFQFPREFRFLLEERKLLSHPDGLFGIAEVADDLLASRAKAKFMVSSPTAAFVTDRPLNR